MNVKKSDKIINALNNFLHEVNYFIQLTFFLSTFALSFLIF